jgi:hypothetical protein
MPQKLFRGRCNVTVWMLPAEVDALDQACFATRQNRAQYIMQAIRERMSTKLVKRMEKSRKAYQANRWKRKKQESISL